MGPSSDMRFGQRMANPASVTADLEIDQAGFEDPFAGMSEDLLQAMEKLSLSERNEGESDS